MTPPLRRVRWPGATRIIAARYPPIALYERVSPDPAVWDALIAAESLVNPRLRDQVGEIRLVPPEDRVSGANASFVMAAFTHLAPGGSRFSDGTYGVYYAASDLDIAVAETAFHFTRIATDSADGPRYENMRVLVSRVDAQFHDVERMPVEERTPLLDPDSYVRSQAFAGPLRAAGSTGLHYPSVRREGGRCLAAFKPKAVGIPTATRMLQYHWDGTAVRRYFDYAADRWVDL